MSPDELDAAREAVSATRAWRDQMRADWGTNFREPEEVLDEAVGELLAERDGLREDRDDWRNIADDAIAELADVKAERDRLRAVVRKLLIAAHVEIDEQVIRYAGGEYRTENSLTADERTALLGAFDQLDVSPDMGGHP